MYANDPWSNIELQDPSRSLNNKEKRSTKHHVLESGYCFCVSSPIDVPSVAFPASLGGQAAAGRALPLPFRCLLVPFWRAVAFSCVRNARVGLAHHCQFCPELIGMGAWGREGCFSTPSLLSSPSQEKKIITFCPVSKKDLDNFIIFLRFFFFCFKYQCMIEQNILVRISFRQSS